MCTDYEYNLEFILKKVRKKTTMPYFVYKVIEASSPQYRKLELQHRFDVFKQAKLKVRSMRAEQDAEDKSAIKIIFADNQEEAEERLTEVREAPILKEWEK